MSAITQTNRVRVGGSGFTIFTFAGQPITFCQQVAHTSPRPVGQGASAIQPLDEPYPVEIITPIAAGMGQLVLNMFELFGSGGKASKTWDRLGASIGNAGSPFGNQDPTTGAGSSTALNLGSNNIFTGAVDIVDVYIRQAQVTPDKLSVTQIIRPLSTQAGTQAQKPYSIQYIGCVITDVQDGEQIEIGTMEVIKQITIAYRYQLRDHQASAAFALRDAALTA